MATTASDAGVMASPRRRVFPTTLCEAFQQTAMRRGGAVALRTPGDAVAISWADYAARVKDIACGLAAHGIERGEPVAVMLTNRPEACVVDAAALHLGATPFSVYNTSSPDQLEYLLRHSAAKVIVTEQQYLERVLEARDRVETLKWVFAVDGPDAGVASLDELAAAGDPEFDFDAAWRAVEPDDVATLIYTSGTTGPPKGVELTHDNILWDMAAWFEVTGFADDGRLMSHLPMAHLADRVFGHYVGIVTGGSVTCVSDPKQAVAAVADCRPTLWLGVPRVWEKLKAALEAKFAAESDPERRAATGRAIEASIEKVRLEQSGQPVPAALRQECELAESAIWAPVRATLGFGADTLLLSGAAPIPLHVLEFFAAIGLPINEGYGMTECSCITTLNRSGARRYGTVGTALPGVELSVATDGELLVRGRLVMRGYRNAPEMTSEAIDADGWFHTGDIAEIDEEGFVRIVDRKKELIINAAGKNMSPANIEAALKGASPLVGVAVAIGDGRPYNTALIVLEPEATVGFAKEHGLADPSPAAMAAEPAVIAEVEGGIARANEKLSRVEQIKRFTIVAGDWVPGGDELTPTLKLKRRPISEKYAEAIDAMY